MTSRVSNLPKKGKIEEKLTLEKIPRFNIRPNSKYKSNAQWAFFKG